MADLDECSTLIRETILQSKYVRVLRLTQFCISNLLHGLCLVAIDLLLVLLFLSLLRYGQCCVEVDQCVE